MASMAKKVNHAGVMIQFCRNHMDCGHWSITAHAFIQQTCMATTWQKTNKSHIIWLYTFFTHPLKMFKSFLSMPMHGTSSKYGIGSNYISRWHLVEHSPSILHAPTFCIHVHQATAHTNIWIPSIWMICSWAHLPSSSATKLAHAFSTPTKVTESDLKPCCCICWNSSNSFWPCPHFTCPNIMLFQMTTSQDSILLNTFQASSMLPNFAYMSTKLLPTKKSESHPLFMVCSWAYLASSSATMLAHAFKTPTKVKEWGHTLSSRICH